MEARAGVRSEEERAEALTDQRLEDLERFRDIEFRAWQAAMEKRFADAFPGGDHVGHCRYHALMIEGIEWKKRLWRAVVERSVSGLVWAALIFIGLAILREFASVVTRIKGGG